MARLLPRIADAKPMADHDSAATLADCRAHLAERNVSTEALDRLARRLEDAPAKERDALLRQFHEAADAYPAVWDTDYGAALLEARGDACTDADLALRLYRAAAKRARSFAAGATSGGEGMARMLAVRRLSAKIEQHEATSKG